MNRLGLGLSALQVQQCIEVLDKDGHVVAKSEAVKGDQPRIAIKWQRGSLADFTDKIVSLRFQVRNGSMYSYWLAE